MATIDIRDKGELVDSIRYADHARIWNKGNGYFEITTDNLGGRIHVEPKDIPNLIKALQKAKELWGKS